MISSAVFLIILVALLGFSESLSAQLPSDTVIVPGDRFGEWGLSMSLDALVRALGPEYRVLQETGIPRTNAYDFRGRNVTVIFAITDRRVVQIGIYRGRNAFGADLGWYEPLREGLARYKTAEGLGLDSPASSLFQAYGQPTYTYDWGRGFKGYVLRNQLYFNADPDGKVSYVAIFRP